jgi:hypothetical protein
MRKYLLIVLALSLTGCGAYNRTVAKYKGLSQVCYEKVSYLQFPSGVTVQYDTTGHVVTCK